ncbi:MAG TPA: NADH-quinone oxidoreductase subunit A [Gemmataceae bacterium]|nr:NADH-quinone oxidoreductase subunit A [Gemmataceae bacterium]
MNLAVYCLLFAVVGVGFIFVHLVLGKLIRPNRPGAEKKTIYECGEPTIGSAWIQFDLRFYVVALLFVIFDVEVAFFFPWAEVFGRANDVAALTPPKVEHKDKPTDADYAAYRDYCQKLLALGPARPSSPALPAACARLARGDFSSFREDSDLVDKGAGVGSDAPSQVIHDASYVAWMAFFDILVFFGVLLVGFAYLWRRGDLAWVRSVAAERAVPPPPAAPLPPVPVKTVAPALTAPVESHH